MLSGKWLGSIKEMRWPAISPTRATLITDCVGGWHINLAWLFGKFALAGVAAGLEALRLQGGDGVDPPSEGARSGKGGL